MPDNNNEQNAVQKRTFSLTDMLKCAIGYAPSIEADDETGELQTTFKFDFMSFVFSVALIFLGAYIAR